MGLTEHRCHNCSKEFWAYGQQNFCCRDCYNEWRRKNKERKETKKPKDFKIILSYEVHVKHTHSDKRADEESATRAAFVTLASHLKHYPPEKLFKVKIVRE